MRNTEELKNYFLGRDPQLKETMSDNAIRLCGIHGKHYLLKKDFAERLQEYPVYQEITTNVFDLTDGNLKPGFYSVKPGCLLKFGTLNNQELTHTASSPILLEISYEGGYRHTTFIDTQNDGVFLINSKTDAITGAARLTYQRISNVIEEIQVNGSTQPIENKTVNLAVPTKTSELENDNLVSDDDELTAEEVYELFDF